MRLSLLSAALAAVLAVACKSGGAPRQVAVAPPGTARVIRSTPASIAAARADSARYPYTDADIQFMTAMVGHHAQALLIAGWAASHGASPAVQRLADRIINGQSDEIATIQQWLSDRNQPVPVPNPSGMGTSVNGVEHHMHMPGMLSHAQLKTLDEARGPAFDRLFLTMMIQHHRGAVAMVEKLFGSQGAAQDQTVFKFASDVNVDQSTEIARMETMLDALPPIQRNQQ